MEILSSGHILVLILFIGLEVDFPCNWMKSSLPSFAAALEDSFHYFTSFEDPHEWTGVYDTCRPSFQSRQGTMSPVILNPHSSGSYIKYKNDSIGIQVFSGKPTYGYFMSFHFPRREKCPPVSRPSTVESDLEWEQIRTDNCLIMERTGLIRAVVLFVDRKEKTVNDFRVDYEDPYVTILSEEGVFEEIREKRFVEAVFLGNPEGSTRYRSSHVIDKISYPMEIYMYFEDPAFPGVHGMTQLVIPVKIGQNENPQVKQLIVSAEKLQREERNSFKETVHLIKKEDYFRKRAFKHLELNQDAEGPTWRHQYESEKRREGTYYSNEYSYQRYLWMRKTGHLMTNELENLNNLEGNAEFDRKIFKTKYNSTVLQEIKLRCPTFDPVVTRIKELKEESDKWNIASKLKIKEKREEYNTKFHVKRDALKEDIEALVNCIRDFKKEFTHNTFLQFLVYENEEKLYNYENLNNALLNKSNTANEFFEGFQVSFNLDGALNFKTYDDHIDEKLFTKGYRKRLNRRRFLALIQNDIRKEGHFYTEAELEKLKTTENVAIKLNYRFQISWLIPPSGGYFRYNGSIPFPPCITVPNTLVFEKPIEMSKSQIQVLSTVPIIVTDPATGKIKVQDIHNTFPPFYGGKEDQNFTYNSKSVKFRRDDGFHRVSRQSKAPISVSESTIVLSLTVLSLIIVFKVC